MLSVKMPVIIKYFCIILKVSYIFGLKIPKIPRSPCPDKFLYKFDRNMWFANLKIGPIDPNTQYIILQTNFTIGAYLPMDAPIGDIQMNETNESAFQKINSGLPFNYVVYFGYREPLPYLTAIILNGQIICAGPRVEQLPYTSYFLQHKATLTKYTHNPSNEIPRPIPNPLPLKINDEPPNFIPTTLRPQTKNFECGIVENNNINPWLVGLFEEKGKFYKFHCSGSLISMKHVMTAAHCTTGRSRIFVKLGSKDVTTYIDPNSISRYSQNIFTHPEYDISIILLNEEVQIGANVRPICVFPKQPDTTSIIGKLSQLVGWVTDGNGVPKPNPTEIDVIVNPLEECDKFDSRLLSDRTICTSGASETSQECIGNTGGALIFSMNNRQMLRGIISLTNVDTNPSFCNINNFYSLFIDITKFFDWINFTLRLA